MLEYEKDVIVTIVSDCMPERGASFDTAAGVDVCTMLKDSLSEVVTATSQRIGE